MYIAIDENNYRTHIFDAQKGTKYFCPVCASPVIVKDGLTNAKHFAHKSGYCVDNWNYDISEWHRRMQEIFPIESREVTVKKGNKIHRADVLIDKTVIEFQHSPISAEEYADRNNFFTSLGYRVAWVFDVTEQFENQKLFFSSDDNEWLMTWKNPLRVFSVGPRPTDTNPNFSVWLAWNSEDDCDSDIINKVIWSAKDDNFDPSFKKIIVSEYYIDLKGNFDINDFFYSKNDYLKIALAKLKQKHTYTVKYIGKKGEARDKYICPRRNEFGLHIFSEKGCSYCKYCYMIAAKKRANKKMWAIYCCYPTQVRDILETHPSYECESAPFYNV